MKYILIVVPVATGPKHSTYNKKPKDTDTNRYDEAWYTNGNASYFAVGKIENTMTLE